MSWDIQAGLNSTPSWSSNIAHNKSAGLSFVRRDPAEIAQPSSNLNACLIILGSVKLASGGMGLAGATVLVMLTALLVEDDVAVAQSLMISLAQMGYSLTHVATAAPAMALSSQSDPDVVLLDLGLPDMDGSTLLMMLKAVSSVPIIILTARGRDDEVVRLLDLGADDYLIKPFSVIQLDARIRAVLRRTATPPARELQIGELRIVPDQRAAWIQDRPVRLRRLEFDILLILAENVGKVVTRPDLVQRIWGTSSKEDTDARIDVHVSSIRAALGERGDTARYLRTVRGVGLRLVDPQRWP